MAGAEGGTEAERAVDPAHWWARLLAGELLEHGGDASDFALAFASLVHGMGGRVRLLNMCSSPSAASGAASWLRRRRSTSSWRRRGGGWGGASCLVLPPPVASHRGYTCGTKRPESRGSASRGAPRCYRGKLPGATGSGSGGGGGGGGLPTANERAS